MKTWDNAKRFVMWLALVLLTACSLPPVSGQAPTGTTSPTPAPSVTDAPTAQPVQQEQAETRPTAQICTVETGYENGTVNVRAGAGMQYTVVDVVTQGEQLIVIGPVIDGWQHVTTQKLVEGWFYVEGWCK